MRCLLPTAFFLALLVPPAWADVVKTVSTEYYTVDGTTPATIAADLKVKSPWNETLGKHTAVTRTKIEVQYTRRKQGRYCSSTGVKVFLHLTYLYPRLVHGVDGKTRAWWREFLTKLEEHERIHGEISTNAAHILNDALEALTKVDCTNYKATAQKRINKVMVKLKKDQTAYDKLTDHGIKQERNQGQYP